MLEKKIYDYTDIIKKEIYEKYRVILKSEEIEKVLKYALRNMAYAIWRYQNVYLRSFFTLYQQVDKLRSYGYYQYCDIKKRICKRKRKNKLFSHIDINQIF